MSKPARVKGIKLLVDKGHSINMQIAKLNSDLDTIKQKIRQHAKSTESSELKGFKSKVSVSDYGTSTVNVEGAWKALGSNIKAFTKVAKVSIGALRKHLSSTEINKITIVSNKAYHIVKFYPIDGLIPEEETKRLPRKLDRG